MEGCPLLSVSRGAGLFAGAAVFLAPTNTDPPRTLPFPTCTLRGSDSAHPALVPEKLPATLGQEEGRRGEAGWRVFVGEVESAPWVFTCGRMKGAAGRLFLAEESATGRLLAFLFALRASGKRCW